MPGNDDLFEKSMEALHKSARAKAKDCDIHNCLIFALIGLDKSRKILERLAEYMLNLNKKTGSVDSELAKISFDLSSNWIISTMMVDEAVNKNKRDK